MRASRALAGVATITILLFLLPCASSSYDISKTDSHPLVECLYGVYTISITPSIFQIFETTYYCYSAVQHYRYSDLTLIEELNYLARGGWT